MKKEDHQMIKIGKVYQLKNGHSVYVVDSYHDYFSDDQFLLLEENGRRFIAKELEVSANILSDVQSSKRTTQEKVSLYRSYFRGDDTMVARSYEKPEDKRGYYVWCRSRKRVPCPKLKNQKFKCSLCKHQNFQPLTDQLIFDHLRGYDNKRKEAFYGMYPINSANQVYFLALDFDKKDWLKAVPALIKSAENFGLQPLLELSQSGRGCHIWFFFEEAVSARQARNLGKLLLRYSMLENPSLSFDSFDRMFPNQDERSIEGFGNLIALPLQGQRYQKGCSRFVNENFELIDAVWETLEQTPKISKHQLTQVIDEVEKELPIHYYKTNNEGSSELLTLFEESKQEITFSKPIGITLKSELLIDRKELSKKELVQLVFMATFHNQAFYIAQRKRLSTYGIPRMICLAEVTNELIYLPKGLLPKICKQFPNAVLNDQRCDGKKIDANFEGKLYPLQEEALSHLTSDDQGILCAGTGFGKTVVAAKLIADKKVSTLVLVHNKNLAVQWKSQLDNLLTIEDEPFTEFTKNGRKRKKDKIGKLYGGKESRSGLVDIALFQSVVKRENLGELFDQYGMVIVDEAHHVAAKTFEDVIKQSNSRYLYGLTATPKREDHLENIIFMRLGEIAFTAEKEIPQHIEQKLFIRFTALGEQLAVTENYSLHENYEMMLESEDRNQQIVSDICDNLSEKRHLIVLSRYVRHLEILKELLVSKKVDAPIYILNSKMKAKDLREELANLKKEGKAFVLLTTGSYAGEGFDLPALDTLMLAMPISGKSNLQQYLGRLLRNLEEKQELKVYDYVDYAIPMIYRMYQKRLRTYKNLGYQLHEDEYTELYKSNLFSEGYEEILFKDISSIASKALLILPYLNKKWFNYLITLKNKNACVLILPEIFTVAQPFQQIYRTFVEQLIASGYVVKLRKKISQSFAVLDKKVVWMMPNHATEEGVALRMYSEEIATRLEKYFDFGHV